MNCLRCQSLIEQERLSILPETKLCAACARLISVKKKKGAMIYSHKTAPTIQIMEEDCFNETWKRYQSNFGMGSGVHKISPRAKGCA